MYGRTIDGKVTTFGTTGYTHNSVFVLYDRDSKTVWYPLSKSSMDGVGGPHKGEQIPVLSHPPITTLGEWRQLHPHTKVLLKDGDPTDEEG